MKARMLLLMLCTMITLPVPAWSGEPAHIGGGHWWTRFLILLLTVMFAAPAMVSAGESLKSTAEDQVGVEVTVYNSNLGLIKDTRNVALPKGEGELRFMDVAAHIRPVTVHVKSLNQPDGFSVLEQNYEYDLINSNKLLDKYVGKKIKIIDWNRYQDRKDVVDAVLMSNNQGQVYKINGEIYLGHPGVKVLPEIPENLIAKPTLTWLFNSATKKRHKLEVSYLTGNISWNADYVVVLNKDDSQADISGWVTLDNKSGATYQDAKLKLVAGEVNQVQPEPLALDEVRAYAARAPMKQEKRFKEEAFFEYHLYDLQRKTTVKDNQTKQLSLLEAHDAKTAKELLVYGLRTYFTRSYREQNPKQPVNVYIKFKNSKDNNLGMPLPAGTMRLYKADSEGGQQFIGEDNIEHTPKDEEIKLKIGEAFDVVAERKQTDYKQVTTRLHETEWEITLRNHKEENVTVGIVEPVYGNWSVIANSHPYKKEDAFTLRFDVDVPKDGEVKVKYRIRVGL